MATVQALDINKANNANNLNLTTSWSGGNVPTASDVAVWDSTVTSANTVELGADLEFLGIEILNPGGRVDMAGDNVLTIGSAGIDMSSATRNLNIAADVQLSASQMWDAGNVLLDSNNNKNNGGITLDNQGHTLTVQVALNANGGVDIGNLTGSGGLIKNGPGWLRMQGNGSFDYTGDVALNDGTLLVGNREGALGSGASSLTLAGGTLTFNSNFDVNYGRNTTVSGDVGMINNSSGGGSVMDYTFGTLSIGAHTLTVNRNSSGAKAGTIIFGATTLSGNATFNVGPHGTDPAGLNQLSVGAVGESGGPRGITKTGEGTLILTAAGTYTGTTRVEAGSLNLTHGSAVAGSETIRVDAGATLNVSAVAGGWTVGASQTLMGRGSVVGNTIVAGTLAPGSSPGNITFANNLTLSGVYEWEYGDLTIVQNVLTLQPTWELNVLSGYGLQDRNDVDGESVALFTYDTRSFNVPTSVTGFGGYLVSDVRDDGMGTIWLDNVGWAAVIPEPGTVVLISLGSMILWFRRRLTA